MCALYSEAFLSKKNQPFQLTAGMEQYLNTDGVRIIRACLCEYGHGLDLNEMMQECLIDVAGALVSYDPSRGSCKLSSYIYACCKNRIKMEWRRLFSEKSQIDRENLSYETLDEQSNSDTLIIQCDTMDDSIIHKDQLAWLHDALNRPEVDLSEDEQQIIELTRLGYKQREIAKIIGASQSYVSTKKTSAIDKLSAMLQKDREQGKVSV